MCVTTQLLTTPDLNRSLTSFRISGPQCLTWLAEAISSQAPGNPTATPSPMPGQEAPGKYLLTSPSVDSHSMLKTDSLMTTRISTKHMALWETRKSHLCQIWNLFWINQDLILRGNPRHSPCRSMESIPRTRMHPTLSNMKFLNLKRRLLKCKLCLSHKKLMLAFRRPLLPKLFKLPQSHSKFPSKLQSHKKRQNRHRPRRMRQSVCKTRLFNNNWDHNQLLL